MNWSSAAPFRRWGRARIERGDQLGRNAHHQEERLSESFNPYSLHSIHIPLEMVAYPDLSWGAKVLYGRLALYLGKPRPGARCNPNLETLAANMGTSVDTIDRWLKELTEQAFIKRRRRGRFSAEIIFLSHPIFDS